MKHRSTRLSAAVIMIAVAVSITAAQTDRERERAENERDLDLRSWNLRMLQLQHEKEKHGRPLPQQALRQLQEDFTQLQVTNRNMLRAVLIDKTIDPRGISQSVSEIKKRAERLNINLALPESSDAAEPITVTKNDLRASVIALGRRIFNFIDNPFFKEAAVLDPQQTATARRDLQAIIQLSAEIKRTADVLKKAER